MIHVGQGGVGGCAGWRGIMTMHWQCQRSSMWRGRFTDEKGNLGHHCHHHYYSYIWSQCCQTLSLALDQYSKLSFGSCLRVSRCRTTLWLWGAWENSFLDFAKASHTEGVPWTTVYDKKRPSVSSSGAKKFTSKSAVPPIFLQNGVLHAAPGSASGSSWFCIRLLLCFRQKQSYGIYQIWVKSNIRIIGMAMPLSKHNWWNASSIFIIPDWSMKPLLLNRRLGFSHVDFSIASPKEATV